jgi:monofunctional biosynthetic peptidoglycan transglycosylase
VARRRSLFRILARGIIVAGLTLFLLFVALVAQYAVAPPISTLMLARLVEGKGYTRTYVRLKDVAPTAVAAVAVSEDATFCQNDGVDWGALREVLSNAGEHGPRRGASTITMQTAKNLFLWPGRSAIRKAIEIPIALVLGKVWPKTRTMEVYLNVAEWGDGLYGIEAASRRYFRKSASELGAREGALLAVSLPNPIKRNPARPKLFQRRLAAIVEARALVSAEQLNCLAR